MSNPFEALDISDDQGDQFVQNKTNQVRKTHKQRRQFKKQTPQPQTNTQVSLNADIPARVKESGNQHKHRRQGGRPYKGLPEGHTLDRRSGTGRQDRFRKQGGGYGNVGNVKDEFNQDKYERPQQEAPTQSTEEIPVQEQVKPQQPEKLTLAEYYQNKGVDLNLTAGQKKAPVKGQVNAEWLQKEKLTLVETKEDKRRQENVKQSVLLHNNTKVERDLANSELLGFGNRPAQKSTEQQPQTDNRKPNGKKVSKVVLKEDDFPTL